MSSLDTTHPAELVEASAATNTDPPPLVPVRIPDEVRTVMRPMTPGTAQRLFDKVEAFISKLSMRTTSGTASVR